MSTLSAAALFLFLSDALAGDLRAAGHAQVLSDNPGSAYVLKDRRAVRCAADGRALVCGLYKDGGMDKSVKLQRIDANSIVLDMGDGVSSRVALTGAGSLFTGISQDFALLE